MKTTLLEILIRKGFSNKESLALIISGQVKVNNEVVSKQGLKFDSNILVEVKQQKEYVSRAAYKLKHALDEWGLDVTNRICMDLGCSHGGFSQVLLERGVQKIYAIDVAYGIFDYKLRNDQAIHIMEKKNIRHIEKEWFADEAIKDFSSKPVFVVCDISFMSLSTVLKALKYFFADIATEALPETMSGVFLLKPQFENSKATQKGILNDPKIVKEVLQKFENQCNDLGYTILNSGKSGLTGRHGNQEYVYHLSF